MSKSNPLEVIANALGGDDGLRTVKKYRRYPQFLL